LPQRAADAVLRQQKDNQQEQAFQQQRAIELPVYLVPHLGIRFGERVDDRVGADQHLLGAVMQAGIRLLPAAGIEIAVDKGDDGASVAMPAGR